MAGAIVPALHAAINLQVGYILYRCACPEVLLRQDKPVGEEEEM
jgi:hypothetical protein